MIKEAMLNFSERSVVQWCREYLDEKRIEQEHFIIPLTNIFPGESEWEIDDIVQNLPQDIKSFLSKLPKIRATLDNAATVCHDARVTQHEREHKRKFRESCVIGFCSLS